MHDNGYYTLYAHLKYKSVCVKLGNRVKSGDIIAYMGNTGHSKGAHLHFEVRDEENIKINPTSYINCDLKKIKNVYMIGKYIVNTEILTVRKQPYISKNDDNWLKFDKLTLNAQKQIKKLNKNNYIPNGLIFGVICDVFEVSGEWGKIPSGWINLKYCKKIN